jgi:hypothetical protein
MVMRTVKQLFRPLSSNPNWNAIKHSNYRGSHQVTLFNIHLGLCVPGMIYASEGLTSQICLAMEQSYEN